MFCGRDFYWNLFGRDFSSEIFFVCASPSLESVGGFFLKECLADLF